MNFVFRCHRNLFEKASSFLRVYYKAVICMFRGNSNPPPPSTHHKQTMHQRKYQNMSFIVCTILARGITEFKQTIRKSADKVLQQKPQPMLLDSVFGHLPFRCPVTAAEESVCLVIEMFTGSSDLFLWPVLDLLDSLRQFFVLCLR